MPVEGIREALERRRRPFGTLLLNVERDPNVSGIVRTHNAFCGREIFYIGRKKYNRRGCVGTYLYENIHHFPTLGEAKAEIPSDYTWIGIDNIPGAIPIQEFDWPENPLLVFGHENGGLDFLPDLTYSCNSILMIPQLGSVRSLNVSVAAGITMYDLAFKKGWL